MTTTRLDEASEAPEVTAAPPRHHFNRRIAAAIAVPVIALTGAGIAYAAVTSSPPPSAESVLTGDGYTLIPPSVFASLGAVIPAADRGYIRSWAVGTKPGGRIELVAVLTPAGQAKITPADLAPGPGAGYTATEDGPVLRVDGHI